MKRLHCLGVGEKWPEIFFLANMDNGITCLRKNGHVIVMKTLEPYVFGDPRKETACIHSGQGTNCINVCKLSQIGV